MKKMGLQTSTKTRATGGTKRARAPKKAADVGEDGSSGDNDTPIKKVKSDGDDRADEKRDQ